MEYLPDANWVQEGRRTAPAIDAAGKHVVIIGGGDTAADCLGTANRQGAAQVTQIDHNPQPPSDRDPIVNPWPQWPKVHKHSPAHEEGVVEAWAREARAFLPDEDGNLRAVLTEQVQTIRLDGRRIFRTVPGSEEELPCGLALLAAGFVGTEPGALLDGLGVAVDGERGTLPVDRQWRTSTERVYACGDASRGASLVVWAIAEGRACAAAVDAALMGGTALPSPVVPGARPL
jgi:glutamate synthase (NADPH/NADH) small chain